MEKYVFTAEKARQADSASPVYGVSLETLMNAAATALFKTVTELAPRRTVILCGSGNNGGDGYALCGLLLDKSFDAVCVPVSENHFSPLCEKMRSALPLSAILSDRNEAERATAAADVVVDCIFGTGFKGELPEYAISLLSAAEKRTLIACDIPSGVRCDGGIPAKGTPTAYKTVTFAFAKPCFFLAPSAIKCGEAVLADIGMPEEAIKLQKPLWRLSDRDTVRSLIKPRPRFSHKGTFGSVQLICGSELMSGAAALAAKGALKSGAGLVFLTLPEDVRRTLQTGLYEPVYTLPDAMPKVTAQVIGCGLGARRGDALPYLMRDIPTVVDADALNFISEGGCRLDSLPLKNMLLTPHPAEFSRLTGLSVTEIENDRFTVASQFAVSYGCTLLLKGHFTLIALPDGSVYVNTSGNSGLAKGGSGDVLAGYAGGLLAQGYTCAEAALIGAFMHGRAAECLAEDGMSEAEMQPSDVLTYIGKKEKLLG